MSTRHANAFLLVLIILLSVSLALPGILRLRTNANRTTSLENLRKLGSAMHAAADTHKQLLPPPYGKYGEFSSPASFHVHLLPFVHEDKVYATFKEGAGNAAAIVPAYHAPQDPSLGSGVGAQNFAVNLRVFYKEIFSLRADDDLPSLALKEFYKPHLVRSFPDGTSNTIMFATKLARCRDGGSHYAANVTDPFAAFFGQHSAHDSAHPSDPRATFQLAPNQEQCLTSPLMAQTFDRKGLLIGLADGSARTITVSLSAQTWNFATHPCD